MGKRGQQFSLTTILIIVIGIIALVLVGLFVSGFFEDISRKAGQTPGQDLQIVAKSCELANAGGLNIDFCTFKKVKVNGKTEYVNCEDSRINNSNNWDLKCDNDNNAIIYCKDNVDSGKWADVKVNGKLCNDFTCSELGGVYVTNIDRTCTDSNREKVSVSDGDCCISTST